jgi:hypothetical protein
MPLKSKMPLQVWILTLAAFAIGTSLVPSACASR